MADRSASEAQDKRIEFRIGVNLGDIIFEDDDIYGDGVNIAARIETLAAPGGICVSHIVSQECEGKIDGGFNDGGEAALKNIARPVHVWHWQRDKAMSAATSSNVTATQHPAPAPGAFEGKPSIAVLPFSNMSSDPEKEYLADGMTEDIITGLSFDSRLFVIARNSTFAYKGQSPDIRAVGRELGVRYVLEGSIRPINDRLRITVQLIDTASGAHVWAEKIDRPAVEIFDIMDEVVDGLVMTLCSNLGAAEARRVARARPEDLQAWALCVQAENIAAWQFTSDTPLASEKLARRATQIDPGYAPGWALLAYITTQRVTSGVSADAAKDMEEGRSLAATALRLAPNDPVVLSYCGMTYTWTGQTARAIGCLEHSVALNPNNASSRLYYGFALWANGEPQAGLAQYEDFFRLSPKDPNTALGHAWVANCYLGLEDYPRAEEAARKAAKLLPALLIGHINLALSLTAQGRVAEAV